MAYHPSVPLQDTRVTHWFKLPVCQFFYYSLSYFFRGACYVLLPTKKIIGFSSFSLV